MLNIINKEYFNTVKAFAERTGRAEQLQKKLDYLDTFAEGDVRGKTRCTLSKDFAPYSFNFLMERKNAGGDYDYWFNGGLIFHGTHDNGGDGSAPTFSVCLTPTDGWEVHT